MIEQREEENSRIGRVLHDEIGQLITAAGLQLDALRRECSADPNAVARLTHVQQIFDQVIGLIRDLNHSLPASAVEHTGLPFALDRLVGRFRQQGGPTIRLMVDPGARPIEPQARAMHRIAECAIDNAVRHSQASLIETLLRPTSRGVELEIRDNGKGFIGSPNPGETGGLGLLLMEHAAQKAGLQLTIKSQPGAGTIVRILDRAAKADHPEEKQ